MKRPRLVCRAIIVGLKARMVQIIFLSMIFMRQDSQLYGVEKTEYFPSHPSGLNALFVSIIEYYKNNSIHICKDIISAVFTTPSTEDPCPSGNCSEYEKIFCYIGYIHLLHISNPKIWQKVGAIVWFIQMMQNLEPFFALFILLCTQSCFNSWKPN